MHLLIHAGLFSHWIFHPLNGLGYQFWSGIEGSIPQVAILGGVWAVVTKHNCHVPGCWKIGKHTIEGTPYVVCRKHHPDIPDNLTLEHIHKAAKSNGE